jgi:seryl-tRNA synthetase
VHMLNSTLCATTRTICAILENYQTPEVRRTHESAQTGQPPSSDGSLPSVQGVRVPEVLVPFMGGLTFLPWVREPRKDAASAKAQDKKKSKVSPAVAVAAGGEQAR